MSAPGWRTIRCADCGLDAEVPRGSDVRWCVRCTERRHAAVCELPWGHDGPCEYELIGPL